MSGIFKYNQDKKQSEDKQPTGKFMGLINLIARKAWDLSKLNLISLLLNLPFFALIWIISYWFIPAEGMEIFNYRVYSPQDAALIDLLWRLSIGSIMIAIPVVIFGPANAGATYIYRNMVKGQPVFIWSDLMKTMKRFLWKSLLITVIDVAMLFVIAMGLRFYSTWYEIAFPDLYSPMVETISVMIILLFTLLFIMMHFYIYQLLIEYNLKIHQLYRYSFVFSLIRLIPNLFVLIACIAMVIGPYTIHIMVGNGLLIFVTIALCGIVINYYTWPALEKHFDPLVKK
ncbi:MAG TPA: DUF624 domain-containing protein [Clostridia bacterium]|nr:DUF624 domain-containing protein [Clostridia bacterium]HRX41398.1 DUF624 domain-containing protein [Clostridia bacterium]